MIFLEATMIVIGLAAVIISFRISDKKVSNTAEVDMEANMQKFDDVKEELSQKAESILESTDDKLSTLSNEKIMGMNEYSDQVMDKIEKNHAEVVFLYDMLNEKQEEVKQLVHDIDSLKAEIHNEAAKGYQSIKEQERQLDELKKDMETESLRLDQDKKEIADKMEKERTDIAENKEDDVEQEFHTLLEETDHDEKSAASVFDEEIAKIEEEEAKNTPQERYRPLYQQEKAANHNDEIIELYKNGRSILEISKMLSIGQGEVKFVIDLHQAASR